MTEQERAECEARYWLSKGYTTKQMVDKLRDEIAKRRGLKAANYLIDNMREEFKKQKKQCERVESERQN